MKIIKKVDWSGLLFFVNTIIFNDLDIEALLDKVKDVNNNDT